MGFNKRFFSESNIRTHANNSFEEFDRYMLNPDAAFLMDDWTRSIYSDYCKQTEDERKLTHEKIKNGTI